MDIAISIRNSSLHTTLFKKPSNLHIYIPPHLCHPPGLLPGTVHGMINRIYNLCTDATYQTTHIQDFYRHLRHRGFQTAGLRRLFQAASNRANAYATVPPPATNELEDTRMTMIFHDWYNHNNHRSQDLQCAWYNTLAMPLNQTQLATVPNHEGATSGISRMSVAYNRQLNLGNILSYRKLQPSIVLLGLETPGRGC
jgi:hypothetical protein